MTIRILLVDDHTVVRAGLRAVLEPEPDLEVVGEADTGATALKLARTLRPDVVVTDLLLPEMDGVAVTERIRDVVPQSHVVILTSVSDDDPAVVRALRAGALGYVLKNAQVELLLQAIRSAAHGRVHLSPRVTARLIQEVRSPREQSLVTDRERQVLRRLVLGHTNKEIAVALSVAETTVKTHVSAILTKLGVESRTQAALKALHLGLVPRATSSS